MGWTPPGPYPTHALIWAIYGPYMIRGLTQPLCSNHPIWNRGSAHDFDASRMSTANPLPSYRHPQPTNTAHMGRSSSKNVKIHICSAAGLNPFMQLTNHTRRTDYVWRTHKRNKDAISYYLQTLPVDWLVLRGLQGPIGPKGTALFAIYIKRTVHTYSWDSIT